MLTTRLTRAGICSQMRDTELGCENLSEQAFLELLLCCVQHATVPVQPSKPVAAGDSACACARTHGQGSPWHASLDRAGFLTSWRCSVTAHMRPGHWRGGTRSQPAVHMLHYSGRRVPTSTCRAAALKPGVLQGSVPVSRKARIPKVKPQRRHAVPKPSMYSCFSDSRPRWLRGTSREQDTRLVEACICLVCHNTHKKVLRSWQGQPGSGCCNRRAATVPEPSASRRRTAAEAESGWSCPEQPLGHADRHARARPGNRGQPDFKSGPGYGVAAQARRQRGLLPGAPLIFADAAHRAGPLPALSSREAAWAGARRKLSPPGAQPPQPAHSAPRSAVCPSSTLLACSALPPILGTGRTLDPLERSGHARAHLCS